MVSKFAGNSRVCVYEDDVLQKIIYETETPYRDRKTKEMVYTRNDLKQVVKELEKEGYTRIYSDIEMEINKLVDSDDMTNEDKMAALSRWRNP